MNRPFPRARSRSRRCAAVLLTAAASTAAILASAPAASAHPLGNATVNHYDGLQLFADHITDTAVEDVAEIPTLQRKPLIDRNSDGQLTPNELDTYAASQCASLAAAERISLGTTRLTLRVTAAAYAERPGAIGLSAGRLVCELNAPADLTNPATVTVEDQWDGAGIGWHELTAVGHGVSLHNSSIPAHSISDALQHYPNDLLSSPLDQRSATLTVTRGTDTSTYATPRSLPTAGAATRLLGNLTTTFNGLVGRQHLTLGVGLAAVLLAMVLGAGHAFLPGHGKTIMAAYLVGKRGGYRDVVTVGATVTLTHTAGVLVIGLLLSLSATLAPTAVEQDLAVVSGLLVAGVGIWLLITALQRRSSAAALGAELAVLGNDSDTASSALAPPVSPAVALADSRSSALPGQAAGPGTATPPAHQHHHYAHEHGDDHNYGHTHGGPGHAHGGPGHTHAGHTHDHEATTHDDLAHHHPHGHGHRHGLFGRHHHHPALATPSGSSPGEEPVGFSRKGLVGLGVAGGLVPSPSALLVLLAAVALGRTVFGIVLVLGYGIGMAAALSAAGLLLVRLRGRLSRMVAGTRLSHVNWLLKALPLLTACLVLLVGVGLVLSALAGTV